MHTVILFVATFLACAVEMVEALTIVLAVAVTRGWRSVRLGVFVALGVLAVVVAVLGSALTQLPLDALRVVVGFLLLALGLQWLRKAILRAGGLVPLHDESAIFEREVAETMEHGAATGRVDWYAFTLSFKGVFLEGLEVAFIVVTFGAAHGDYGLAIGAALAALVAVVVVGAFVHGPLSRVPENAMKFTVGLMLTAFGTFWGAEGAGASWPGGEVALLGLLAIYSVVALGLVRWLRSTTVASPAGGVA
jgi:uncharacterized membrane protein